MFGISLWVSYPPCDCGMARKGADCTGISGTWERPAELVPVPRLPLVPDAQHPHHVQRHIVAVQREVAGSAVRDHQFTAVRVDAPADAWMRFQYGDRTTDLRQRRGCCSRR